ncbi:MAG: hypothetical protein ACKPIC_00370, partial [Microcystis panniformis]
TQTPKKDKSYLLYLDFPRINILAMAKSLTEPEFKQYNTNELLDTEVLTQIGFEAKFFKFDL